MSNYSSLLAAVNAAITANGTGAITGPVLNTVLQQMIVSLGQGGYIFKGRAIPTTDPGSPDQNVFYIATTPGTYTNFSSIVVAAGECAILKGSGTSWSKEATGIDLVSVSQNTSTGHTDINIGSDSYPVASVEEVSQLGKKINLYNKGYENGNSLDGVVVDNRYGGYVFSTSGAYSESATYKSITMAVQPGDLIISSLLPTIITCFGKSFEQTDFIDYIHSPKKVTCVPAGCYWLSIGFYNYAGGAIVKKLRKKPLVKFLNDRLENFVCNIYGNFSNDNSYDCCLFYCEGAYRVNYSSATKGVNVTSAILCFFDEDFTFISYKDVANYKSADVPSDAVYGALSINHSPQITAREFVYINVCLPNINSIVRYGPSYLEFGRADYNKQGMAAVGMHGSGEANLCWNMDYEMGVHKYYDKTIAALWLALNSGGFAMQYAPANLADSGDNDIWDNGGNLYTIWVDAASGKLVTATSVSQAKGNACFSGDHSKVGGIDLAGLETCVIEGCRVVGTAGDVSINKHNTGAVKIAGGGGKVVIGGGANAVSNTPPSSATDAGEKGEVRFCSDAIYVCIATNTWVKCALATW